MKTDSTPRQREDRIKAALEDMFGVELQDTDVLRLRPEDTLEITRVDVTIPRTFGQQWLRAQTDDQLRAAALILEQQGREAKLELVREELARRAGFSSLHDARSAQQAAASLGARAIAEMEGRLDAARKRRSGACRLLEKLDRIRDDVDRDGAAAHAEVQVLEREVKALRALYQ